LIDSLLLPSKAIKENYHALLVTTTRGQQFTGIKVRETKTVLTLRTDQDKEIAIPVKTIEEQTPSKVSLMPDGLTDTLTRAELLGLVRFLSELGKGERWSVGRQKVARRWEVLEPNRETYRVLVGKSLSALAAGEPGLTWEPVYSTVNGSLPLASLPTFRLGKEGQPQTLLRTQIEATAASKVQLKLNAAKGLSIWLDGEPVKPASAVTLDLKPGVHTLSIHVDRGERKDELRLEVEDTPAAASVRFIGGK